MNNDLDVDIATADFRRRCPWVKMGRYSYVGRVGIIGELKWGGGLSIGSFCSLSDCLTFMISGDHRTDWVTTFPFPHFFTEATHIKNDVTIRGPIVIGNDVWIGDSATILHGVTIGDGAVIGAHAVVAKSIPSYAIAVGNPVRVIKYRFSPSIIDRLLKVKWWDWPDAKIAEFIPYLLSSDIHTFLDKAERSDQ